MAGLTELFKGLLGSVGNGRENRDDDVRQVKRGFGALGYWEEPKHGLNGVIDRALDAGTKSFQDDHELKVDGWLAPDGPTEGALKARLASADRLRYPDIRVKPGRSWEGKGWGGPRGTFGVPTIGTERERIDAILGDSPARFKIEDNPDARPGPVLYRSSDPATDAVRNFDRQITSASTKRALDPDLVRSVMWAEVSRGQYGAPLDDLGISRSKLPMNVQPHFARLVGEPPEKMVDPDVNIEAGAELLKRIRDRVDRPTPAKIGSIWNYSGQDRVTDFGADVARIYVEKPWLRPRRGLLEQVPY